MRRIVVCYWNAGGFYFESDPMTRYNTESSMFRKASEMGYTHVTTRHGFYSVADGFVDRDIAPRTSRIPKKYRKDR